MIKHTKVNNSTYTAQNGRFTVYLDVRHDYRRTRNSKPETLKTYSIIDWGTSGVKNEDTSTTYRGIGGIRTAIKRIEKIILMA
jgi:hypothetical protein